MPVRKASFGLCVALICSILYLLLHNITNIIYNAVKQPYMDEIFHIPQAQLYCHNNFTYYDPKITTPPGLYIITYIRLWIRDKILMRRSELICDIIDLRRTNHLLAIFNFVTVVLIQLSSSRLNQQQRSLIFNNNNDNDINNLRYYYERFKRSGFKQQIGYTMEHSTTLDLAKILLTSLVITILPPLFFFNSLYYTDAGSMLFTLLAYLFSINDQHTIASLIGIVSILFRQTNIVWLFYSACLVIHKTFDEYYYKYNYNKRKKNDNNGSDDDDGDNNDNNKRNATLNSKVVNSYYDLIYDKKFLFNLIERCLPYSIVGIMFIIFVFINKGIVLGDREAHQPKLHFAQILYFLGFCSIFGTSWMFNLRILRRFLYFTIRSPLTAIIASLLIIYLISFGRYAHPYLLADNRHLTFYIWRRILDRHNSYVPYLLTPVYLISSLSIWHHLRTKGCKQMLIFIMCTMLVIVPNGLLEPRYFLIPYVFLRLSTESNLIGLLIELSQSLIINIGMYYLFLFKTFKWADSSEVQRIMW